MGLFYTIPQKELQQIRNKIFVERGIPVLEKNGFKKSPFSTAWFGRNNLGDYTYELCRITKDSNLEILLTHIVKGDRSIQIYLNIFKLSPHIDSLDELNNADGLLFNLPPNKITRMLLRSDDFDGIPLFNFVQHKLKSYYSKQGFQKSVRDLSDLIEIDLSNINHFVDRWHTKYKLMKTDWDGNPFHVQD